MVRSPGPARPPTRSWRRRRLLQQATSWSWVFLSSWFIQICDKSLGAREVVTDEGAVIPPLCLQIARRSVARMQLRKSPGTLRRDLVPRRAPASQRYNAAFERRLRKHAELGLREDECCEIATSASALS